MSKSKKNLLKQPKTRAIIYARVSTKEQKDTGYSIDSQIALLRGYCLAKGFDVIEEISEADTAKESGRIGFARMCRLLRTGKAEAIVVEKTDRLYRNLKDRVTIDELQKELHFVKEGSILTPSSKSADKFIADIKLVVAKNYCDNLSEEAKKGMLEKAQQGIYPSHAPVGYINTARDGRRIIEQCPNLGPKIKLLFKVYANGDCSSRLLSKFASEIGLTSKRGKQLSHSVIHNMLRSKIYIGKFDWNGIEYQGIHEPLVDMATWRMVQNILDGRTKESQPVSKDFTYRGLIRCTCGCLLSAYIKKGRYVYYSCSGFKGCKPKLIREEAITEAVAARFEELAIEDRYLLPLRKRLRVLFEENKDYHFKTFELMEAQKATIDGKLSDLYLDLQTKRISVTTYDSLRGTWEKEALAIQDQLETAREGKAASWEDMAYFCDSLSNLASRFKMAENEQKREMFIGALSNCVFDGENLSFSHRSWFKTVFVANSEYRANPKLYGMAGATGLEPATYGFGDRRSTN